MDQIEKADQQYQHLIDQGIDAIETLQTENVELRAALKAILPYAVGLDSRDPRYQRAKALLAQIEKG